MRFANHAPLNAPDPGTCFTAGPRGYIDYPKLSASEESIALVNK